MADDRTSSGERPRVVWARLWPFTILLVAGLAYVNSFAAPFLFDDVTALVLNPGIRQWWPLNYSPRPVADLTFRVNYVLGGLEPAGYHVVNAIIHALTGLLLYGCVRRTLRLPRLSGRYSAGEAAALAAAAATLWVAHPLQTESVTYVCQRYESLMGLLLFWTLYAFLRGVQATDGRRRRWWFDLSIAWCALGMGVKAVMVVAPLLALVLDRMFVAASWREVWRERRWVHAGLFLTWAFYGLAEFAFTVHTAGLGVSAPRVDTTLSPLAYLVTQVGVIAHYLRLSVWPHPLCLDYAWELAREWQDVAAPAFLIVPLGLAALAGLWRGAAWGFLLAAFFVALAPTSSLAPVPDIAFEHRMYVALAPLAILTVAGLYAALRRTIPTPGARRAAAAALWLVALAALTLTTVRRNADYLSEERMWRDVVSKRPGNLRARMGLGKSLMASGQWPAAEPVLRGLLVEVQASVRDGRAYRTVSANNPNYLYYGAADLLGRTLIARGKLAEAREVAAEAIRWRPDGPDAYCLLATINIAEARCDEAILLCRKALTLDPESKAAHGLLASLFARSGAFRDAAVHYRAAVRLAPDHANLAAEYAWLLATCPVDWLRDGKEAARQANRAVELSGGGSHRGLDILAAALAESGRFPEAAATAEAALRLVDERIAGSARGGGEAAERNGAELRATRKEIEERLALFRAGKPYRQPMPDAATLAPRAGTTPGEDLTGREPVPPK
jgi:tetratricopeptide (TPR) repeat protein